MKKLLIFIAIAISSVNSANAAGYSSWAVPTRLESVNGGMLISGSFGNPNSCDSSTADHIYIHDTNPSYEAVIAMAMTALTAQKEMRFYIDTCEAAVTAHWTATVNVLGNNDPAYMR